mmetsp:Transcript_125130/g.325083  ORF Transcript_125130/g.325083 Transcript_125130/m.325083 type:complete len:85 (+) Transcript_125130:1678-1932(+)
MQAALRSDSFAVAEHLLELIQGRVSPCKRHMVRRCSHQKVARQASKHMERDAGERPRGHPALGSNGGESDGARTNVVQPRIMLA